ncbi:MAG: NifB/NifX family molybdenum-iron cluster-binding protein [Promethearchaeia archaeon]
MKYAISSSEGKVFGHFGRAPEFTFIEVKDGEVVEKETYPNPGHSVGSIPKFVNKKGADYMIAGGMGRRAIQFFQKYGIEPILGITGSIDDIIQKILNGTLEGKESICKPGAGKQSGRGIPKELTEADFKRKKEGHHNH